MLSIAIGVIESSNDKNQQIKRKKLSVRFSVSKLLKGLKRVHNRKPVIKTSKIKEVCEDKNVNIPIKLHL